MIPKELIPKGDNAMWIPLEILGLLSCLGGLLTFNILPKFHDMFIKANIFGIDLNKANRTTKVPEASGVITGCVFLMITILMIPLTFSQWIMQTGQPFPHAEFVQLLASLLSISCMLLLGFADDVLDLRWRHKLLLPSMASVPLLMVYYVTTNRTQIVVPIILRQFLGDSIDLHILYYVYMSLLAVFCTNAINILAGINGLEVGQSIIIASSIALFNFGEMNGPLGDYHRFSLYFLIPYLATSLPLLYYNWYPARIFPGDTFCYFSGMTLAVVAILGHFSKTLLLFFIPQIFNFVYSVPQLFHLIPCPRHRLPKYDKDSDKVGMSKALFKAKDLNALGKLCLKVFVLFKLVDVKFFDKDGDRYIEVNNLTLINFILRLFGPMHERTITIVLLCIQLACSVVAFFVRYPLAMWFYGEVIA